MAQVVGIDLGTSNSAVAALISGKHQIIADESGRRLTPSVVSFGKDKQILIGDDAKAHLFSNPKRTIHSIKRLIGRKIFSPEVEKAKALLPYPIVEGPDQNCAIEIDGQPYLPQEVSAIILKRMKEIAEARLHEPVEKAVVTVPAYFNDNQRQATADACRIAGLEAIRMINEPTAAALAYGFGKGLNETVAVYDLGGGTFDISILKLKDQVFEVLSTAGDTFLGGDDFDDRIIDLCAEFFLKQNSIDLRTVPQALPLLRMHAERAKRKLSYAEKTDIYIPGIVQDNQQALDLHFPLSRETFKTSCGDLVQRTFTVCDEALRTAGVKSTQLDAVILVGGPTKMNVVYDAVAAYFGKPPMRDLNPDEVVAIGAAIQASSLSGGQPATARKSLLLDVTPLDLGIATVGGYTETLIEANTPIPVQATRVFTTTKDNQKTVDIRIFQGKNRREEEGTQLGEFEFSGFKTAKSGDVSIEVTFGINTDGIVEVSAKDPTTGVAQTLKVKLSSSISGEKLRDSQVKAKEHKQVRLKSEYKDFKKVVLCLPSKGGNYYEEGFLKEIDPKIEKFVLNPETGKKTKEIDRAKVAWVLLVEDFANTARYIQAVTEKPTKIMNPPRMQLYEFRLKDGTRVYGQADLPKMKELGFWMEPYFSMDELPGKIYLYSSQVNEAIPIAV